MIKISGTFRVNSIYVGDGKDYIVLKDKADGSQVKLTFEHPTPKVVTDDALVKLEGDCIPSIYNNNLSLMFKGSASAGSDAK